MNSDHKQTLSDLLDIMEKLRDPKQGCRWDLQQTSRSLIPYIIEESYELVEVLDIGDTEKTCDELGDLLLQIVFQAQIAKEEKSFDMEKIIGKAIDKMIRRHPHIFGSEKKTKTVAEQKLTWEKIKEKERLNKGEDPSPFKSINKFLPAVNQALKLQNTASSLGFDFNDAETILTETLEKFSETEKAIQKKNENEMKNEIGDLFFLIINLSRILKIDPELCIRDANKKFSERCTEYFQSRDLFKSENDSTKHFSNDFT